MVDRPAESAVSEKSRDLETAWKALEENDIPKAIEVANRVARQEPDNAEAFDVLGCTFARAGHDVRAIEYFHTAVRLNPNSTKTFLRYVSLSVACGFTSRAIRELEERLQEEPESYLLWLYHGQALQKHGRRDDASQSYLNALRVAGDSGGEHFENSWRDLVASETATLFHLLKKHITADGEKLHFARHLSQLALKAGDYDCAEQAIQKGKAKHPADAVLEAAAIDLLVSKRDWQRAYTRAQKALHIRGDSEDLIVAFVRVLWATGRLSEALDLCNAVLSQQPHFIRLLEVTGQILLSLEQYAGAVTTLSQVWQWSQGRYQSGLLMTSALSADFDLEDHSICIELDDADADLMFFLPLVNYVIDHAVDVCIRCSRKLRLLLHHLFPGVLLLDSEDGLSGPLDIEWFPVPFAQLVPIVLREASAKDRLPISPVSLPTFRTGMVQRQFGLTSPSPLIAIEQVFLPLLDKGSRDGRDLSQKIQILGLEFSAQKMQLTQMGEAHDAVHELDSVQLAALISGCKAVISSPGPLANMAAALGVDTWIVGADEGLPRWYLYNQTTPSPLYPNVHLIGGTEGSSYPDIIQTTLTSILER